MQEVCSNCGVPSCVVVAAQRAPATSTATGDGASAVSEVLSSSVSLYLARFCVSCGHPLLNVDAAEPAPPAADDAVSSMAATSQLPCQQCSFSSCSSSSDWRTSKSDASVTPYAVVPVSVVRAALHAVASQHVDEKRALEREVALLRARASEAAPASTQSPPKLFSAALQDTCAGASHSSGGARVIRSLQVPYAAATASCGSVEAAVALRNTRHYYQQHLLPHQAETTKQPFAAPPCCVGRAAAHSRSRSPSIVVPPFDANDAVKGAPVAELLHPPPPRCSQTQPRHSHSCNSEAEVSASPPLPGGNTEAWRRWSLFVRAEEEGLCADARPLAQGQEQQRTYERLRDALLRQL